MAKPAIKPTTSFTDILDTPATEVSKPRPTPIGTYLCMVKGNYEEGKTPNTQTPYVDFTLQYRQAQDDVDEEALSEYLTQGDGQVTKLADKTIRYRLWTSDNALWRLLKFLKDLGIPEKDENGETYTVREMMQLAPNCQCLVYIKHRASNDGENMYAEIARTAKTEED
jgi:hypothetical protein